MRDDPSLAVGAKPKIRLRKNNGRFVLDESEPEPRLVRVEFAGPAPVMKMAESKLGEVRYNGTVINLGEVKNTGTVVKTAAPIQVRDSELRVTLPEEFKVTRASSPTRRFLYNHDSRQDVDYVQIARDNLDDGRETVVTIYLDWAKDFKFRVSDTSGVAATYGNASVLKYYYHDIIGKNLPDTLRMDRERKTIEVTGEYLAASKVDSNPPGFATLNAGDPRLIDLDFDKLQPGNDGDVRIDFKRRLPKEFQIQPVVAVGGKFEPYLNCTYTIDAGGAPTGTRRTQLQDGTKGLSLDALVEGQAALALRAKCGDKPLKTFPLTPEVLAKKTPGGYAQVEVMKIIRFYAGLARSTDIQNEEVLNIWSQTLKFVQELYGHLRQADKVQTAVLVVENEDSNDTVTPSETLTTDPFPPDDRLPGLQDRIFNSRNVAAGFGFEKTLKRFKQVAFKDVGFALIVDTPQTFSTCKSLANKYSGEAAGSAINVVFINGMSLSPPQADPAFQLLPGSNDIFQCPGAPPGLRIYAFDALSALQSTKGWGERLKVLQKEIAKTW
jgi:hypothetical protein